MLSVVSIVSVVLIGTSTVTLSFSELDQETGINLNLFGPILTHLDQFGPPMDPFEPKKDLNVPLEPI